METHVLAEFTNFFPSDRLITNADRLKSYGESLQGTSLAPELVVLPVNAEEIKQVLRWASTHGFTVHPVSRGKNFGYGETQPLNKKTVVLDLSKMNRISEFDEALGIVSIEPGVSQKELFRFLADQPGRPWEFDMTGGGLSASVTGNILERGFGHSEGGDRYQRSLSMTVMLADGSIIKTGSRSLNIQHSARAHRYGLGPVFDGLFSQSNLGVVIEMTLELQKRPEYREFIFLIIKEESELGELIGTLRDLRLETTVQSTIHVANLGRIADQNTKVKGSWFASMVISGPKSITSAKRKWIRSRISKRFPNSKFLWFNHSRLRFLKWVDQKIKAIPNLDLILSQVSLLDCEPNDSPYQVLLKDPKATSSVTAKDFNACLYWISAVCPTIPSEVQKIEKMARDAFASHGFEYRVTMTFISARTIIFIFNTSSDKSSEGLRRSRAFFEIFSSKIQESGCFPYRSGAGLFETLPERQPEVQDFLRLLKKSLDPDRIISPGKYNID